jgi:hypothetical protein
MRRLLLLLAVAATVGTVFASVDAGAAGPRARANKMRLTRFGSCGPLVKYARRHALRELHGGGPVLAPSSAPPGTRSPDTAQTSAPGTAPQGAPTPSAGTAADSSQTNVQEAGVDEPDIVKSDGAHIFALAGSRLNAVDARTATPKLLGSLDLGSYGGELLLYGKRVLVVSYAPGPVEVAPPGGPGPRPAKAAQTGSGGGGAAVSPGIAYPVRQATLITEVDVSDPAAMRVVRTETVDGFYVSARLNGASARVVLSTPPAALDYYGGEPALRSRARGIQPRATVENKVTGRKSTKLITGCGRVRRAKVFSGLDTLSVLTIDMRKGLPAVDTESVMTDGQTVYASNDSLYVATQRFVDQPAKADQPPPPLTTAIHRFDISNPARTIYRSSGEVPGYVLNQFALSEYKGVLRVATTDSPEWWPGATAPKIQSYVSTLKESAGALLPLGRVRGIGVGERIQGVRFIDAAGYVVTFRQVDPLFTIDLSKPNDPRVAGELKLLGYSAYLHPVGAGMLLGVGQDATDQGRQLGTQLSLFDVSNLAHPARLAQRRIGSNASSEVEYDHHAFLYWPATKLAVIPVDIFGNGSNQFTGAIGFRVKPTAIDEVGRVVHDSAQYPVAIRRSLVVGDRLFTISELGAKASALSTFADEAWVPFPQPNYGGGGNPSGQPARP